MQSAAISLPASSTPLKKKIKKRLHRTAEVEHSTFNRQLYMPAHVIFFMACHLMCIKAIATSTRRAYAHGVQSCRGFCSTSKWLPLPLFYSLIMEGESETECTHRTVTASHFQIILHASTSCYTFSSIISHCVHILPELCLRLFFLL